MLLREGAGLFKKKKNMLPIGREQVTVKGNNMLPIGSRVTVKGKNMPPRGRKQGNC